MNEMRTTHSAIRAGAAAVARSAFAGSALLLAATLAWPLQTGTSPQGRPFASGGISHEELTAMYARRESYNLWVVTAALGSGAHLADVRVVIRNDKRESVFDGRLQGPWLFVDLPLGRYEVEALINNESHKRVTTIHRGDLHQAFFYFATGDQLSPEHRSPFPSSPYAGKKP